MINNTYGMVDKIHNTVAKMQGMVAKEHGMTAVEYGRKVWRVAVWRGVMAILCGFACCLNAMGQQWQPAGDAMFTDGWIAPYFGRIDDASRSWTVAIDVSADGNYYRLVDPYHCDEFLSKCGDGCVSDDWHCDVVIDCSNKNYVKVAYQPLFKFADREGEEMSGKSIWGQSRAAYLEETGRTESVITQAGLNCRFHDGVITIPGCVIGFSEMAMEGGNTWNCGYMTTTVKLLGDASIIDVECRVDDSVEVQRVEYYSLQGVRLAAPPKGMPYIVRRGGQAVKHM
jgi:hypothetical protein